MAFSGEDVGVVVPTHGRPELLDRALRSVRAQTTQPGRVVVVLDGDDERTRAALRAHDALPLEVEVVDPPRGAAHARNVGAARAGTPLVAFLDDDDEWLPRKLERQLPALEQAEAAFTRIRIDFGAKAAEPAPDPLDGRPLCEYLFDRRRPWRRAGLVQTSTIVARRELLERVPFDASLARHSDWDWALRAAATAAVAEVPEPLVVWHAEPDRARLSTRSDWHGALEWARARRGLFTARAYAGFLLVSAYALARRQRARGAARVLLHEARTHGRPTRSQLALFALLSVAQPDLLERVRR